MRDRLYCLCVLRYWHKLVRDNCLYKYLELTQDAVTRFKQAFTFFHKYESMGKQVTQLKLYLNKQSDIYTTLILPRLLPNLTSLVWNVAASQEKFSAEYWEPPSDKVCSNAFRYWSKLEKVYFSLQPAGFPVAVHVLSGADLRHLKELYVYVANARTNDSEDSGGGVEFDFSCENWNDQNFQATIIK